MAKIIKLYGIKCPERTSDPNLGFLPGVALNVLKGHQTPAWGSNPRYEGITYSYPKGVIEISEVPSGLDLCEAHILGRCPKLGSEVLSGLYTFNLYFRTFKT